MEPINHKKEILARLVASEGDQFVHNEEAILEAFKHKLDNQSTLVIKILSICGGFIATIAFLGFLAFAGLYNSEFGLLILGSIFIITGITLTKLNASLIFDTFSISTFVCGFALLIGGLVLMEINENTVPLIIMVIAMIAMFLTSNYMLTFISILIIGASLIGHIVIIESFHLIHVYNTVVTLLLAYVFQNEAKLISFHPSISKRYDPIRIGLVFALLFGLIAIGKRFLIPINQNQIWLSSIAIILVLLFLIYQIIQILNIRNSLHQIGIFLLSSLTIASIFYAPSILGAILIILCSYLVNYKTSFVLGIIALSYFISQYYYDLNLTLLTKSIILFSSGVLCCLFYFFINKKTVAHEEI